MPDAELTYQMVYQMVDIGVKSARLGLTGVVLSLDAQLVSLYEQVTAEGTPSWEAVYTFLRKAILKDYLGRGCHLVERDLARDLGTGRTSVREAFRRLEAEGLVKHSPNKGVVVAGLSYADISEIYQVRSVLEGFAARLAAQRACPRELDELERVLQPGSAEANREEGVSFHGVLIRIAGNSWLERLVEPLREYIHSFHFTSFLREGRREEASREHLAILEALRAGDADLAERLAREHISNSHDSFVKALGMDLQGGLPNWRDDGRSAT